ACERRVYATRSRPVSSFTQPQFTGQPCLVKRVKRARRATDNFGRDRQRRQQMNDLILLLVWTGLLGSVIGTVFLWATKHSKRKAGTLAMVGLLVLSLGVEFIRYSAEEQRREEAMLQAAAERERQKTAFVEEWQDEIGQYLLNPMTN